MHKKVIVLTLLVSGTTACVTNPKIADVSQDVKHVTFVQHGKEPWKYAFGVVDGTSCWASADTSSVGSVAGMGAQVATDAVSVAASGAVAAEEDRVPNFMRKMIDGYPMVANFSKDMFPAVARSWHLHYNSKKLKIVPADKPIEDKNGVYTGPGKNSDLVLVLSIDNVTLTEKASVGGLFAAMFTAGFNAKTVVPVISASVVAYKKDFKTGQMKRVWQNYCGTNALSVDGGIKFPKLEKDPREGRSLMVQSSQLMDKQCMKMASAWE